MEFSDSLSNASVTDLGVILMGAGYEVKELYGQLPLFLGYKSLCDQIRKDNVYSSLASLLDLLIMHEVEVSICFCIKQKVVCSCVWMITK